MPHLILSFPFLFLFLPSFLLQQAPIRVLVYVCWLGPQTETMCMTQLDGT